VTGHGETFLLGVVFGVVGPTGLSSVDIPSVQSLEGCRVARPVASRRGYTYGVKMQSAIARRAGSCLGDARVPLPPNSTTQEADMQ
jgi:hypothetical protein